MVDKTPVQLASITRPANRLAAAHFMDNGNSRETAVRDIVEWGWISEQHFTTALSEVIFTNLDEYSELLIIARAVTKSVSSILNMTVSSDNGSSFYTTSGDYVSIPATGIETNGTSLALHNTNATAARSAVAKIMGFNIAEVKPVQTLTATASQCLITQMVAMNAIRIFPTSGNLNSGTIYLLGR